MKIHVALQFVGVPYKWAGNNPMEGFDCSGLVCELLRTEGIISRNQDLSSIGLYNYLRYNKKWIETHFPSPGDVVFYGSDVKKIRHTAYALSNPTCIEAGGGDINTKDLSAAIKANACTRVRPINHRKDFLVCLTVK